MRCAVYPSKFLRISLMESPPNLSRKASASFFAPRDRRVEPYIRIATGDYHDLLAACGRDNALAAYLNSLAHEVIHYQQWIATGETTERGVVRRAAKMVDRYALTVDHP